MPVWAVWSREHLLFSTSAQSRKAKNIAHNPYVVIGAEPSDDAIVLEGDAVLIADEAWKREFCSAYAAKYSWNMDNFSEPICAVRPRLAFWFGTGEGEFIGGSTRWTFTRA